jgi:hypothetical protein
MGNPGREQTDGEFERGRPEPDMPQNTRARSPLSSIGALPGRYVRKLRRLRTGRRCWGISKHIIHRYSHLETASKEKAAVEGIDD